MDLVLLGPVIAALAGGSGYAAWTWWRNRRVRALALVRGPVRAGRYLGTHPAASGEHNAVLGATDELFVIATLSGVQPLLTLPIQEVRSAAVVNHAEWKRDPRLVVTTGQFVGPDNVDMVRAVMRRTEWVTVISATSGTVALLHGERAAADEVCAFVQSELARAARPPRPDRRF